MALPCVDDSCSIQATVNPDTRHLMLEAKIDDAGGLICRESRGLGIEILGDPDPEVPVNHDFFKLRLTSGGELWVAPRNAYVHNFHSGTSGVTALGIPNNGDETSGNPITVGTRTVSNPFPHAAIAIIAYRLRFGFTIENVADGEAIWAGKDLDGTRWTPYAAQLAGWMRTTVTAGTTNWDKHFVPISGVHNGAAVNRRHDSWGTIITQIPAGGTITLGAAAEQYSNDNQRRNVNTAGPAVAPVFNQRGLNCAGRVIVLPMDLGTTPEPNPGD